MSRPNSLGPKIKGLRDQGYKIREIKDILKCSQSIVSYHLGSQSQRDNYCKRAVKNKPNTHPFSKKLVDFKKRIQRNIEKTKRNNIAALNDKIWRFHKNWETGMKEKPTFRLNDVKNKFGDNPKCYLTGRQINIDQPATYHFDHVVPSSKGGTNTLDNLQIAVCNANSAKSDMLLEDFLQMCKEICIQHNIKTI